MRKPRKPRRSIKRRGVTLKNRSDYTRCQETVLITLYRASQTGRSHELSVRQWSDLCNVPTKRHIMGKALDDLETQSFIQKNRFNEGVKYQYQITEKGKLSIEGKL